MGNLQTIKKEFLEKLDKATNLKELENLELEYFGRQRGKLTEILRTLKNLPEEERKKQGKEANILKEEFLNLLAGKRSEFLKIKKEEELKKEWIDVTAPGEKILKGHLHPLSKIIDEISSIFEGMGFEIADGPEVEDEWHNFDALNIPENHSAREMWDTFWLRQNELKVKSEKLKVIEKNSYKLQAKSYKLLLRTHTSPVQIRYMQSHNPPLRIIAPGRIFRYEATDASHSHTFYQLEGLMVDKDINIANFKAVITTFFQKLFKKDIKIRLRPSYYPFVEPGFDIDVSCVICNGEARQNFAKQNLSGQECGVCSKKGWLELAGAGMVHPNVFKAVGYNPKDWQGFAFGFGIDRLAMMKYKIPDIRLFYSGDLRFLRQF